MMKRLPWLFVLLVSVAFAGVDTLEMTSNSTPDQWTASIGFKYSCVNTPDDDATTYIYSDANPDTQDFVVGDLPASPGTIDSVVVSSRGKRNAGNSKWMPHLVLSGNVSSGASHVAGPNWTTYTDLFTTKPGGGSWTESDVNNTEARVICDDNDQCNLTTLILVVYSTAAAADDDDDFFPFFPGY